MKHLLQITGEFCGELNELLKSISIVQLSGREDICSFSKLIVPVHQFCTILYVYVTARSNQFVYLDKFVSLCTQGIK